MSLFDKLNKEFLSIAFLAANKEGEGYDFDRDYPFAVAFLTAFKETRFRFDATAREGAQGPFHALFVERSANTPSLALTLDDIQKTVRDMLALREECIRKNTSERTIVTLNAALSELETARVDMESWNVGAVSTVPATLIAA